MTRTLHDEVGGSRLELGWGINLDWYTLARFAQLVVEREHEHLATTSWACEKNTLEGVLDIAVTTQRRRSSRSAVLDLGRAVGEGCLGWIWLHGGSIDLRVAARSVDHLAAARDWIRERYPVTETTEEQRINITFWSRGCYGASSNLRRIDVPPWAEVADNYPADVAASVARLVGEEFEPGVGGRLLLWHGPPGTGKTYALRALGWEWRNWCDLHYVTDPETFFGSSPSYMLDVLLDQDDEDDDRWRLLILEDTGELLSADAKERSGQGLSRLLNVVDGLIGQGLRVLVLVTTNEPLRNLHAAVSRPGRCAVQIQFAPFSADGAAEWLARRGLPNPGRGGTLATLFGHEDGHEQPERPRIGFAR
jgi:hypothetical protein